MFAAIAILGFMHEWKSGHVFLGVRNVNEDFFVLCARMSVSF